MKDRTAKTLFRLFTMLTIPVMVLFLYGCIEEKKPATEEHHALEGMAKLVKKKAGVDDTNKRRTIVVNGEKK